MRINHNISAMNAHRLLNVNNTLGGKALEKLSSGKRINRAGDDAAGMAISEKMRAQVNGLKMASRNTLDGVSLVQTAEGAMAEVHSMLQRMRELAVQSANGTMTDADRSAIQDEVNQLTSEINRIGNGTEYNTRNILKGNEGPDSNTQVHRMSTGSAAIYLSTKGFADDASVQALGNLQNESLSVWINGDEKVVNLNRLNGSASVTKDTLLDCINDALGKDAKAIFRDDNTIEIKTASISGDSQVEITGSSKGIIFGVDAVTGNYKVNGSAENASGTSKGSFYFDKLPQEGSILTIGSEKIEFYDSSKSPYIGSNRGVDIHSGVTGKFSDLTITTNSIKGVTAAKATATVEAAAGDTLMVTAGADGISFNNIGVRIEQNTSDTLDVSATTGSEIVIKLADTTPGNNTAAAIQTAVRALGTVGGTDYSQFTFTAGGSWDAATTGGTLTTATGTMTGGVDAVTEVPGEYSFDVTTPFKEGDKITIGGKIYTGVSGAATAASGEFSIDGDKNAQATSLRAAIGAFDGTRFAVTGTNATITLTENVGQATGSDIAISSGGYKTLEDIVGEIANKISIDNINLAQDGNVKERLVVTSTKVGFEGNLTYLEGTLEEFNTNLQIGANTGQGFRLEIGDIRSQNLRISADNPDGNPGVKGASYLATATVTDGISSNKVEYALDVSSEEKASAAIKVLDNAIIQIAGERAKLGATQNRLEHTIANLDNTSENLTAAMSRIEDADMALEMAEYQKLNVLQQAGVSMLAQANQQPQAILKLLG